MHTQYIILLHLDLLQLRLLIFSFKLHLDKLVAVQHEKVFSI